MTGKLGDTGEELGDLDLNVRLWSGRRSGFGCEQNVGKEEMWSPGFWLCQAVLIHLPEVIKAAPP